MYSHWSTTTAGCCQPWNQKPAKALVEGRNSSPLCHIQYAKSDPYGHSHNPNFAYAAKHKSANPSMTRFPNHKLNILYQYQRIRKWNSTKEGKRHRWHREDITPCIRITNEEPFSCGVCGPMGRLRQHTTQYKWLPHKVGPPFRAHASIHANNPRTLLPLPPTNQPL